MRRIPILRRKPDPTITLINVVFLMLTFFLVAGTMAPPPPSDVRLVSLNEADPVVPPDVLAITADGRTLGQGREVDPAAYVAALPVDAAGIVRLMPDRDLPARDLIRIARELRAAGAAEVRLTGERGGAQ